MNITIFACVDFPEGPATTSRVRLIAKILTVAGHNVSLAIFNANTRKPIPENRQTSGYFESIHYKYLSGKTFRPPNFTGKLFDTLKGISNSLRYLRNQKRQNLVDAVLFYTPGLYQSLPAILLSRHFKLPIILEMCEIFSVDTRKSGAVPCIKRFGARISEKILPNLSSGILAISMKINTLLQEQGVDGHKILHLPILVDHARFICSSTSPIAVLEGKDFFLNSGALNEKEGLEFILEAFAAVSKYHEQIKMVFTGAVDLPRKHHVMELATCLKIEDKLVFTGFLSFDQLLWAYRNALALLCCRPNTAFANFGFPTKLAEYLSSGRPVIATAVGDMLLYLNDGVNAFISKAEDSNKIAQHMTKILDDPALASRVGLEGRKVAAEHFDYNIFVETLDMFLRSICAASASKMTSPQKSEERRPYR